MDALDGELHTDLSVRDVYAFSSRLSPDRRLELAEGSSCRRRATAWGSTFLVVIGRTGPSDYRPLKDFIGAPGPS